MLAASSCNHHLVSNPKPNPDPDPDPDPTPTPTLTANPNPNEVSLGDVPLELLLDIVAASTGREQIDHQTRQVRVRGRGRGRVIGGADRPPDTPGQRPGLLP